jgi:uncharacterized phage protein gp47/JayE
VPLPVTSFIVQRIFEYDPSVRVTSGSGLYELMVAPLSIILQPIRDEIDSLAASQSILQVLESATPNTFDGDVVDSLLSNMRVERKRGTSASTTIRLSFFTAQDFSATARTLTFLTGSGLGFVNTISVSVTQAQMSASYDGFDFYVDIPCVASASGANYNVAANTIAIMQSEPANVSSVTNPNAVVGGITEETNLQFIERARDAISVRTLVSAPGISSTITEAFIGIREVSSTGFGDAEMMRDIISNVHVGGYVDAWMKPATTSRGAQFSTEPGLEIDTTREEPASELVNFASEEPAVDSAHGAFPNYFEPGASTATTLFHSTLTSVSAAEFVVSSQDESVVYLEGLDYTATISGQLTRLFGSRIAYIETAQGAGTPGAVTVDGATKTLTDLSVNFLTLSVSVGDRVLIDQAAFGDGTHSGPHPGTGVDVDGAYTVTSVVTNSLGLSGLPVGGYTNVYAASGFGYAVHGLALVSYAFNPVSIDIIGTVRAGRDDYTITDVPVLKIDSAELLDPITGDPTGIIIPQSGGWGEGGYSDGPYGIGGVDGWSLYVENPHERFSAREDLFIDFGTTYMNQRVQITYEHSPDIPSVDDYVTAPANRDIAADILAKHVVPAFFNAPITYEVDPANTTITTTNMLEAIEGLINTLGIGQSLELSDIVDLLYDNGVVKVVLPIDAEIAIHNTDGSFQVSPSEDELIVPTNLDDDPNARPLSPRITHIMPGTITLTQNIA